MTNKEAQYTEMSEEEKIDRNLEIVRQRDYPSLTLDEMRDVFNETYERICKELDEGQRLRSKQ